MMEQRRGKEKQGKEERTVEQSKGEKGEEKR